jgi:hypothetical protein
VVSVAIEVYVQAGRVQVITVSQEVRAGHGVEQGHLLAGKTGVAARDVALGPGFSQIHDHEPPFPEAFPGKRNEIAEGGVRIPGGAD